MEKASATVNGSKTTPGNRPMYHCNILVYTTGLITILWINYPSGHVAWQWCPCCVGVTSFRRKNDVAASFRCDGGIVVASCVRWAWALTRSNHFIYYVYNILTFFEHQRHEKQICRGCPGYLRRSHWLSIGPPGVSGLASTGMEKASATVNGSKTTPGNRPMYHCNILVYTTGLITILWINYPSGHVAWQWCPCCVGVTSFRRKNDVAASFRCDGGIVVASCVRWAWALTRSNHFIYYVYNRMYFLE